MTREIEARLKLSAVDRTAAAFKAVSGRMAAMDAKAKAMTAASAAYATKARVESKAAAVAAAAGRAELAATAAVVKGYVAPVAGGLGAATSFKTFAAFDRKMTDIGVTADATKEQIDGAARAVREISQASAMPLDQTVEGLDSLVAAGRDLPDAMAFLPSVVRTARAASAEVVDIAKSADAMGESFKIAAGDMEKAFDIADYLGKKGKFELKDQARYLPSIAPLAATRGLLGLDGLARVGAASQVIRKNAGTAEEAAASVSDVLGKLDADETIKRMKKEFGVDLPKALAKARKEGRNTFDAFLDITELAIKGDFEKINRIFGDKEARRGLTALMMYRDEYKKLVADAKNAPGTVATDHAKKIGDAQAALDRLSNSAMHAAASVGKLMDTMGVSTALESFGSFIDVDSDKLEKLIGAIKEKRPQAAVTAAFGDKLNFVGGAAKIIGHYIDPKSPVERYREDLAAAGAEAARRLAKARSEVARIDGIRARYGSDPLPAVLQAQYDAAKRVVDEPRDLGKRYPTLADALAPDRDAADAASEIRRQRARIGLGRADISALPVPRPAPIDIPTKLDDREIDGEIQRLRARLQSSLDAQPLVLRTRVEPARRGVDTGRSFQDGDFAGAP